MRGTWALFGSALVHPLLLQHLALVQLAQLVVLLSSHGSACLQLGQVAGGVGYPSTGQMLQHVALQYTGALVAPLLVMALCEATCRRSWLQGRSKQEPNGAKLWR